MKYMGGKQQLLRRGLGGIILEALRGKRRFIDLMAGSAAVSHFVATNRPVPVWANDLQSYSKVLALSVLMRNRKTDTDFLRDIALLAQKAVDAARVSVAESILAADDVSSARAMCESVPDLGGFIWRHYGGHYYSPRQALLLDALYEGLPTSGESRSLAHASLIYAASRCAAAPGHTAQPFQPTARLLPYLSEAWSRDPIRAFLEAGQMLGSLFSHAIGHATVGNALDLAHSVNDADVVFLDPPYSAAQYSRFYHVLEAIAVGGYSFVDGAGRMPPGQTRPKSEFSMVTASEHAMDRLLGVLGDRGATVVTTYPNRMCSNGLSGDDMMRLAGKYFDIVYREVATIHSTMGGPKDRRGARRHVTELLVTLRPR